MVPLTETTLATAREHWREHGSDSYRLVVRVRPPRTDPEMYDLVVAGGSLVKVERDGAALPPEEIARADYSMAGIFALLQTDLRWNRIDTVVDTPAVDLRAEFEPETGRLVRYRRTIGTERRRVLVVEVLSYEPAASLQAAARAAD